MVFDRHTLTSVAFWVTALTIASVWLTTVAGSMPTRFAAYATTGAAAAYALSRAIDKFGGDLKRGWRTTEFAVATVQVAIAGVATLEGSLSTRSFGLIMATLAGVLSLARALATPFPVQANAVAYEQMGLVDDETLAAMPRDEGDAESITQEQNLRSEDA